MRFDKKIIIQKVDEATELWSDVWTLHAAVNNANTSKTAEYSGAAIETKRILTFTVRFAAPLNAIAYQTSAFRILFEGVVFNITNFDDFMLEHKTIRFTGVSEYV